MKLIFHCTQRMAWNAAIKQGAYVAPSLEEQGFIHLSTMDQVLAVADRLFRGQKDLVLLCVDAEKLAGEVRYENFEGGTQLFPHVYGPIDLKAVVRVVDFPCEADGTFRLPSAIKG